VPKKINKKLLGIPAHGHRPARLRPRIIPNKKRATRRNAEKRELKAKYDEDKLE